MGIFKKKYDLILREKRKGYAENTYIIQDGMNDKDFIEWSKKVYALYNPASYEWCYVFDNKKNRIVYDCTMGY